MLRVLGKPILQRTMRTIVEAVEVSGGSKTVANSIMTTGKKSGLVSQVAHWLNPKNTVEMVFRGERGGMQCFTFIDNGVHIGSAKLSTGVTRALSDMYPVEWYKNVEKAAAHRKGKDLIWLEAKPTLYINEIMMYDCINGLKGQRPSDKKYGTMCMQKILEYAEQNGYGSRIYLQAAKHGSNIPPGKFYAKIGFEGHPSSKASAERLYQNDLRRYEYAKNLPDSDPFKEELLLDVPIKPDYIDGRWVPENGQGDMFLVAPEVLKNYPL